MGPLMELTAQEIGDALVITIHDDRIDAVAAVRFKDSIATNARSGPDRVVLDLTAVNFVDSSGLGAIVAVMKILSPKRKLDLCGLTPIVEKVFSLTRMDRVFAIYPSITEALATHADSI